MPTTLLATVRLLAVVALAASATSCAALEGLAALRQVNFRIDQVSDARLAGVGIDRFRSYQELELTDLARIAGALAQRQAPLAMTLHLGAHNPSDNAVTARLARLDWTLFLEGRETVRGVYERPVDLPPGQTVGIPLQLQLDLLQFFGDNARELVEIGLRATGHGSGTPANVRLVARPTIDTPIGPIRYPGDITITTTF
jgi:hypothetical protein